MNEIDVEFDVKDVIEDIPTKSLVEELSERLDDIENGDVTYNKKERHRSTTLSVPIDPDDYGLVDRDEISASDVGENEMISALECRGYVVNVKESDIIDIDGLDYKAIQSLPKWKIRELFCNLCGVSHLTSTEDLLNELRSTFE